MFLFDYVFFPVGTEKHWMLVYACIKTRKLFYLDSLLSERRANDVLSNIKAYMYIVQLIREAPRQGQRLGFRHGDRQDRSTADKRY